MNSFSNNPLESSPTLRWLVGSTNNYICETQSALRVNQLTMENQIRTVFQVQILTQLAATGGYIVRVQILQTTQSQKQGLHQLIGALNQVSETLEIETDAFGGSQRICNRPALLAKWPGVRAALRQRFRQIPQTEALLSGLDQQLVTPGALESAILPNGLYGVFFAGGLGRSFPYQAAEIPEARVLPRFFGTLDLPLLLQRRAEPPQGLLGNEVQLVAAGTLNEAVFDAESWRRLLRQITDTPNLDTTLTLAYHAAHELRVLDGTLRTATQHVRVEVPGVYCNELTHRLTLQPSQP